MDSALGPALQVAEKLLVSLLELGDSATITITVYQ